ncbi:DUF4258 domain-containing protein [Nonomuraea deserti]|uniref:DUF4258 domain-containing protein n=1 Tax=Nonomuraea deserti TaxID=1848322 RepID=A0A4R4U7I3_9ACTN|nr:DUF4258 domain-containing protein [Nonomuraea deserti]TDC87398.1 DUF4258 domain-containing protein [Nonomuraea deserti]
MSVTIPPVVDAVAEWAGIHFPNVDEDAIVATARDLRVVNAYAESSAQDSDATMRPAVNAYQGAGGAELASFWQQTGGGEAGHLQRAANTAGHAPPLLEGAANIVSAGKVAAAAQVLSLAQVAPALLAGGAAGAGLAMARILATRRAVHQIDNQVRHTVGDRLANLVRERVSVPLRELLPRITRPNGGMADLAGANGARIRATGLPRDPYATGGTPGPSTMAMGNKRGSGGYSDHARKRQGERGVSDDMVDQAIETGKKQSGKTPGTTFHKGKNVWAVTDDKSGRVVSTGWLGRRKK